MKTNISYPRKNSLAGRCLARMLKHEILMHRDADKVSGSYRLSGYVHYLQIKHGWHIDRCEVVEATPDPIGRNAPLAKYWLPDWLIKWAGTDGQSYADDVLNLEAKRIAAREAVTSLAAETKSTPLNSLVNQSSTNGLAIGKHGELDGAN